MTLRLHLNENTGGCSPAVLAALRTLSADDIAQYPDYGAATAACERWFGVPAGWVQLTNGLDEGIQIAAQHAGMVFGARFEAIVIEPAFEMSAQFTESAGGTVVPIPPQPEFAFPMDELRSAVSARTGIIFLTNPNNPTGLSIPGGAIEAIAAYAPHALVFVDEAYGDFSGRTFIGPSLSRFRNVVVGRTFAKAHGLAGLRAGALVAHPARLVGLRRLLPPYSPNICATRALGAALNDRSYLDQYVEASRRSRDLIYAFCDRVGLTCWTSEANFVLVRIGDRVQDVTTGLALRGVFVRDVSGHPGCAGCLRMTAGREDHTRVCLSALEDILASRRD